METVLTHMRLSNSCEKLVNWHTCTGEQGPQRATGDVRMIRH